MLEAFLQEAYAKPKRTEEEYEFRYLLIDCISWRLSQCYRYAEPPQIQEAIAPLTFLVEGHRKYGRDKKFDIQPFLYLATALSRVEGEEERAIQTWGEAMAKLRDAEDQPATSNNLIWARANMARMYRRMGKIAEAKVQEKLTREWILGHAFTMTPTAFKNLLADDLGTGSHILDHPSTVRLFDKFEETGPNTAIYRDGSRAIDIQYQIPGYAPAYTGSRWL